MVHIDSLRSLIFENANGEAVTLKLSLLWLELICNFESQLRANVIEPAIFRNGVVAVGFQEEINLFEIF